jgi:CheY-like chemotaxis protein
MRLNQVFSAWKMDGVETVQRIRVLGGKYEELTIVALTANAVQCARKLFFSNGFKPWITYSA